MPAHQVLTDEDVACIRALRRAGIKTTDLATLYGVSQGHISKVTTGKRRTSHGYGALAPLLSLLAEGFAAGQAPLIRSKASVRAAAKTELL
jgi:transcriptional regulator with XRE-family HTH domain